MPVSRGYHFYQNPGPTNIPDRVLRAMDRGSIDFTGAQFKAIAEECFAGLKRVFKTDQTILGYAASGHGAWEAALVNLFSPGDKVLVLESGFFSLNWGMRGEAFGLEVETLANDWRSAVNPTRLESRLREDRDHAIKGAQIGDEHLVVGMPRAGSVEIEAVGVLHQELAPAHHTKARPHLVAEFPLDVIEDLWQVAIAPDRGTDNLGYLFFIGRAVQHLALVPIADAEHFLAVVVVTPALPP